MPIPNRVPPPYRRGGKTTTKTNKVIIPAKKEPVSWNQFKTAAVHNIDIPNQKIQQYLDGMEWEVTYFNSLIGEDDAVRTLDTDAQDPTIQYEKIFNTIIKVSEPLSFANASDVEGTGKITSGIKAHPGDMFEAVVSGGRTALLRVTDVEDGFYNTNEVYTITYRLDSFLDTDTGKERYADLESKVARKKIFDKDFIFTESEPILTLDDFNDKKEIENYSEGLVDLWANSAVSKHRTITIPGLNKNIVDPYVEEFMFTISEYTQHPKLIEVNRSDREPVNTIYDLLLERSKFWDNYKTTIGMIGKNILSRDPLYAELKYSQVEGLIAFDDGSNNIRERDYYTNVASTLGEGFTEMITIDKVNDGAPVFLTGGESTTDGLNWVVGLPLYPLDHVHLTNQQSIDLFDAIKAKVDAYLESLNTNPEDEEETTEDSEVIDVNVPITTEEEMEVVLQRLGVKQDIIDYFKSIDLMTTYLNIPEADRPDEEGLKRLLRQPGSSGLLVNWILINNGAEVPDVIQTQITNNIAEIKKAIVPIIPEKSPISGTYVLTDAFYKKDIPNMSILEIQIHEYLQDHVLSHTSMRRLIEDIHRWNDLQRFYYVPIVYLLSIYFLRTAFTSDPRS